MTDSSIDHPSPGPKSFATTRWSLVVAAAGEDSAVAREALATLCSQYWYPLYAYVRRQGRDAHHAEDLTQAFFAMLLDRGDFAKARPERGKFRSYLLMALKHFLIDERNRDQALKRGGGRTLERLDFATAEMRYSREPSAGSTPEANFERQWALTLLARVQQLLSEEYPRTGKERLFCRLQQMLTRDPQAGSLAEAARDLGMTEGAVKVALHRLRERFGGQLREEIAQTVATPEEVDEEIRDLFEALRK